MESDKRGMFWESSNILRPSYRSYFTDQAIRSGYEGPELGSLHLEHFQGYDYLQQPRCYPPSRSFPRPHPRDIQDAIQIEIEKEQIRKDIIWSEIVRRRAVEAVEAEVRRERQKEREWTLRQRNDGLIYSSAMTMGFGLSKRLPVLGTRAEQWSLAERTVSSFMGTERPIGSYETTPGGTVDLKFSDFNPISENANEKERIIFQVNPPVSENDKEKERIFLGAKPDENISGSKRKVETSPPEVDATNSPSDDTLRKKAKIPWTSAICQISATSQQALKDHLQGKKHNSKAAAMKLQVPGINYCIGFCP